VRPASKSEHTASRCARSVRRWIGGSVDLARDAMTIALEKCNDELHLLRPTMFEVRRACAPRGV